MRHSRVTFAILLVVACAAIPIRATAATNKTYTHAADAYSFTYPSTWTTKKFTKSVGVVPPTTSTKSLAAKGVSYSANVQLLNNDTAALTASLKASLKKSWSGFATAYSKALAAKLGARVTVSAYTRAGWNASLLTFTKTERGVKTTWRVVLLSNDKVNVYSVSEKWTKQTTSPFATTIAALIKSLTPFSSVSWTFNGTKWVVSGTPPSCQQPLRIASPIDVTLATSILYPGQYRGGNYKAHGGFRLAETSSGTVTVRVPQDARVVNAASYLEFGERQYLFDLISPCGIMYRFDHLRTLAPVFAALAAQVPQNGEGDSRTTTFTKTIMVKAGAPIATAIGFAQTANYSFDFGMYDLRQRNAASASTTWAAEHANNIQQAYHALCWLKHLSPTDSAFVLGLPGTDFVAGTSSDYCS